MVLLLNKNFRKGRGSVALAGPQGPETASSPSEADSQSGSGARTSMYSFVDYVLSNYIILI